MARDSNIRVSSLDFDGIKNNLKDYLKGQSIFQDYNFDGSALSTLLDILAYNTHYMGFYNNMVANEMFMDSAVKRSSVASIAKHLGYQPGSASSPRALVDIVLSAPGSDVILPKGTRFSISDGRNNYNYVNLHAVTVDSDANVNDLNTPHITSLVLYEGAIMTQSFVNDSSQLGQKFILPQKNVDRSTIVVKVQKSVADSTGYSDGWAEATDITEIGPTSKIYKVVENTSGRLEVRFGENVLGKALDHGNLITVEYLITTGPNSNGVGAADRSTNRSFSSSSGLISEVRVVSEAQGGSLREPVDSIRFNAPMFFASQNRAVTAADYKAILQKEFPSLASLNVYGGELANPPEYGRVLVVVKPNSGTKITDNTKREIENLILNSKGIVAINAKVIDPTYVYMKITSDIEVDTDMTTLTPDEIVAMAKTILVSYANDELERFESGLRFSKLVKMIDDVDQGILGNQTNISLEYRLNPSVGVNSTYRISISNPIHHPHDGHKAVVRTNEFTYKDSANVTQSGIIEDDGKFNLVLKKKIDNGLYEKDKNIGSIDYTNGIIFVDRIKFMSTGSYPEIRFAINPDTQDILSINDVILIIDENDPTALSLTAYASPGGRLVGTSTSEKLTKTRTSITGDITPDLSGGLGGGISSN